MLRYCGERIGTLCHLLGILGSTSEDIPQTRCLDASEPHNGILVSFLLHVFLETVLIVFGIITRLITMKASMEARSPVFYEEEKFAQYISFITQY